jgi:hypothetical protein
MIEWFSDGRRAIAAAIVFAVVVGAWMLRYEQWPYGMHRNRLTGAVCDYRQSCWFCLVGDQCR